MNKLLLFPILSVIFISGCIGQPETPTPTLVPTPQYSVEVTEAPTSATTAFTIKWDVNGPSGQSFTHTAIHYDFVSRSGTFGTDVSAGGSGYGKLTEVQQGTTPQSFNVEITPEQSGTFYFRAHAIINELNYWSDEKSIQVTGVTTPSPTPTPTPTPTVAAKEFTIEADDVGFYIDGKDIGSISVTEGDNVKITFQVRSQGVYFGGLDFKGCGRSTTGIKPSGTGVMEFTAASTCTITSFWPASGRVKDTMQVVVA